jgi:DNA polymerase elongation subunit (family B)
MQISFIPIDYDYFDYEGKNYAKIIGRSDTGKKVALIDSCDIYFWAILKPKVSDKKIKELQEKIESLEVENNSRKSKVIKTEVHKKKFLSKEVKAIKIFIKNYKDAIAFAEKIDFKEIDKKRECDINFITKYIIEKKLKPLKWYKIDCVVLTKGDFGGVSESLDVDLCFKIDKISEANDKEYKPKILAYDIETNEFEIGKGEILMISLVSEKYKKVLTWKGEPKKSNVQKYKNEEEMLLAFVSEIKKYSPDILVGYFSDGFDLPYIKERADKLKIKLELGVDNSGPVFSRGNLLTGKIKGIVHIDIFRFIKNAYSQYLQSETHSLNDVSNELLGEKKLDFNSWEQIKSGKLDWEEFYDYNLQDSILTYKLIDKIWDDLSIITKIVEEPLFDVSRNTMASDFEDYIIHNLERFNEIAEKRPGHKDIKSRRESLKYVGAMVIQPKPGLYENVCFFDFSSMYASVIVTYNLSKSTYLDKKIKEANIGEYNGKKVFFSKKQGFVPVLLKEIIDKRRKYKEEYNKNPNPISKARSNAFKLIANAAYGYQGFFGGRYYSIEAASSTAYFARENLKSAIEKVKKEGYKVIYADTDSIVLIVEKHTQKQVQEMLENINKDLPGIMELDLEGFYKRGIWVTKRTGEFGAKKKYALIDEKGKLKIRGFETVRRDWCNLARATQNKVLELILEDGKKDRALDYLKKVIEKIKSRKADLEELIIKTQLKKSIQEYRSEAPHVTIAKKMKEKNIPFQIGTIIEYYISEPKGNKKRTLIRERAKLPSEKGEYDIEYYLKNQILPAVENIFEVFNINVIELVEGRKQMKLGDF